MSHNACFVMMPFTSQYQEYYKQIFAPAIKRAELVPVKADEIYTPTQISEDIFRLIQGAELILADVTGKNPNVNYELGIAHALGKKAVIITQSSDDIPFDYRHLRYITYDTKLAGWERRLKYQIDRGIRAAIATNAPTTMIAGDDLKSVFSFLENTALDSSYEVTKYNLVNSDSNGHCSVEQNWTIRAKSSVTHILHGVILDDPGFINLTRAYDKTNGSALKTLVLLGEQKRVRYVILLNQMLRPGETLQFDFEYYAENYMSHLFSRHTITMFQRPNSRHAVTYRRRVDVYSFPSSEFTRSLCVRFNEGAPQERFDISEIDGRISITVEMEWPEPYDGSYSYEIYYKSP